MRRQSFETCAIMPDTTRPPYSRTCRRASSLIVAIVLENGVWMERVGSCGSRRSRVCTMKSSRDPICVGQSYGSRKGGENGTYYSGVHKSFFPIVCSIVSTYLERSLGLRDHLSASLRSWSTTVSWMVPRIRGWKLPEQATSYRFLHQ